MPKSKWKYRRNIISIVLCYCLLSACNTVLEQHGNLENGIATTMQFSRTHTYAQKAKATIAKQRLNNKYAILIDMSLHSGVPRMCIWSYEKDTIVAVGLVSHGCGPFAWGKDQSKINPTFSNVADSHCSSLGQYIIKDRGSSSWGIGINYSLHGLDSSNSAAFNRAIVLHSWDAIADDAVYPSGTPEGWGCPAVSNRFMQLLDDYLKVNKASTLMWIYN
jgi:hypothetical protein